MGAVFSLEARVKFAEAWLKDKNSSVNKLISATEEAIEAMEAKYDEQELSYKAVSYTHLTLPTILRV